ncbi:MAG: hypothetical protein IPF83_14800 [Rhodanobacteraceae bacterium]|nr:hypothetical protein [Rhodanobacteraceae bacterium]
MNGRLVWRALLAGTGFNIAVSLLMSFGSTAVFNMVDPAQFALLSFALRIVSALADIGGGAIAGYIARDDGPIHGALTSLIATLAVTPVALLRLWQIKRAGGEVHPWCRVLDRLRPMDLGRPIPRRHGRFHRRRTA